MNCTSIILYLLIICSCISCSQVNDTEKCFAGKISYVTNTLPVKKLKPHKIEIEGIYQGPVVVYDSLLFYYPMNASAANFYDIYNLKDGSLLGRFCNKGGGPAEVIALTTIAHFYKEDGDLKTLLYAGNEKKLLEWNISESLKQQKTVFDKIALYNWDVDNHNTVYSRIFRLHSDTLFTITPTLSLTLDLLTVSLPVYEKRTLSTNKCIHSYSVFLDTPQSDDIKLLLPENFFSSIYGIKPDLSKVAQSLMYLHQINILDVNTGVVKGFRMEGSSDFSVFKNNVNKVKSNYIDLAVSDNFIYALFLGVSINTPGKRAETSCQVHVYDWEGNFLHKIDLEHYVDQIALDDVNNLLYGREYTSEQIYCYDLNRL